MNGVKLALRILSVPLFVVGSFGVFLYCANDDTLSIDEYTISSSKLPSGYHKKIVQISDFHNHQLTYKNGTNLLDTIDSLSPDIIVSTGDLVDDHTTDDDLLRLNTLFSHLSIYPTYSVGGNHEGNIKDQTIVTKTNKILSDSGVIAVDGVDLDKKVYQGISKKVDANLTISGLADPSYTGNDKAFFMENFGNVDEQLTTLSKNLDSSSFNLLLTHRPDNFKKSQVYDFDLTLAGHTHGGQVKIGDWHVLSWGIPYPSYLEGEYKGDNKERTLIVSRGLGSSYNAPVRFNCRAQLVVINLEGK
jgi:predicted MPP superfamily phosphohydrolase